MIDQGTTFVLIAPGFDLVQVAIWTSHLRSECCEVVIVGLTSGPLRSTNGVRWIPDRELDEVMGDAPGLLLLPGGKECAAAIGRDPRVLQYVQTVQESLGIVAGASEVQAILPEVRISVILSTGNGGRMDLDDVIANPGGEGRGRRLQIRVDAQGKIRRL